MSSADLWHEVGHALIAPDAGWLLDGWGQGDVYDLRPGGPELPHAGTEPGASALGIWLHWRVGGDALGASRHAEDHNWIWSNGWRREELRHFAETLQAEGERPSGQRATRRLRALGLPCPSLPAWRSPPVTQLTDNTNGQGVLFQRRSAVRIP